MNFIQPTGDSIKQFLETTSNNPCGNGEFMLLVSPNIETMEEPPKTHLQRRASCAKRKKKRSRKSKRLRFESNERGDVGDDNGDGGGSGLTAVVVANTNTSARSKKRVLAREGPFRAGVALLFRGTHARAHAHQCGSQGKMALVWCAATRALVLYQHASGAVRRQQQ